MFVRRWQALIAACALAGGLALTAPVPASAATPTTLSVLSWNIDLATAAVDWAENENASGRTPVIESIIRQHNADVVILDEDFNDTSNAQIPQDLADLYPYHTPVLGLVCSGGGWNSVSGDCSSAPWVINGGTQILSKYPIQAQYAYVYANSTSYDTDANKGVVLAQLDINGTNVWVAGTHLQADQSGTSTDTTQSIRLKQLGEARTFIDNTVGSSGPVLFGGDLNVEYYGGASRGDYPNAESALGAYLGTPATTPGENLTSMDCPVSAWCQYMAGVESFPTNYADDLDYLGYLNDAGRAVPSAESDVQILFDPQSGWAPGQLDTNAPSDHYPVEATYTFG